MKLVTALTVAVVLSQQPTSPFDPAGKWKAEFVGPLEDRPRTVTEIVLSLEWQGDRLIGVAQVGDWLGDLPLSDVRLAGDRLYFSAVGTTPWWSRAPNHSLSGIPKLTFEGTLVDGEIRLALNWGNVVSGVRDGKSLVNVEERAPRDLPMVAKRAPR